MNGSGTRAVVVLLSRLSHGGSARRRCQRRGDTMRFIYNYSHFIRKRYNGHTLCELKPWMLETLASALSCVLYPQTIAATPRECYEAMNYIFYRSEGYETEAAELLRQCYRDRNERTKSYYTRAEAMQKDETWNDTNRYFVTCLEILAQRPTKKSWKRFTYGFNTPNTPRSHDI